MDALRLRMRAKDQLHPILQELVTGFARFKGSKDWEGRSRMVGWLITLNGMKASEEITEEQSRQVHRVVEFLSFILKPISTGSYYLTSIMLTPNSLGVWVEVKRKDMSEVYVRCLRSRCVFERLQVS
jgi:VPS28 protein